MHAPSSVFTRPTRFMSEKSRDWGEKSLIRTACPPAGTVIVADLSALITLDRIGILDEALAHFGKIIIPASYQPELLHELSSLRAIQPSKLVGLKAIRDAVDRERILIYRIDMEVAGNMATLHEYREPDETGGFAVRDVATHLLKLGRIGTDQFELLLCDVRRSSSAGTEDVRAVFESGALISDELTLALLHKHDALDPLLKSACVYIEEEEITRIPAALQNAEFDGVIIQWHEALRERLASDPRFETTSVPAGNQELRAEDDKTDGDENETTHNSAAFADRRWLALHAYEIAHFSSLPLLVDDRTLQSVLFNGSPGSAFAAFGTGDLLHELGETRRLTLKTAAQLYLRLIRLRYRFLLPPAHFLVELAREHRSHPPGELLREIARYVHDCMRDPGLHGGMEPTDPPMSMAVSLCQQWAMTVGEFIMAVWHDDEFDDDAAAVLTQWVAGECLPSIPRNCSPTVAVILGQMLPRFVLSGAFVPVFRIGNPARTSRALEEIAKAFSLTDEAYMQIVSDILHAMVGTARDENSIPEDLVRLLAVTALRHLSTGESRAHYSLFRLGIIEPKQREDRLSTKQISELANRAWHEKLGFPEGPLALITEKEGSGSPIMIPVTDVLLDEDVNVRSAALSFLRSLADTLPYKLSEHSRSVIKEYSSKLLSNERDQWFEAACHFIQVLENDYILALAGFRQKLCAGLNEPEQQYWKKLVRPGRSLAASVQAAECDPAADPAHASSVIARIVRESATLRVAMDAYMEHFGHLPLARPLSSGAVVRQWLDLRVDSPGSWTRSGYGHHLGMIRSAATMPVVSSWKSRPWSRRR